MLVVEIEHPNLSQHESGILQHLAAFRREGKLCDLVVQSNEGTQHRAHKAVLCAASLNFKHMLLGSFLEADQAQQGQPVEIPASDAVVAALLEHVYGGQPKLELEDSIELLNLADAYGLSQLARAIEGGLYTSLYQAPVATALKILQLRHGLHDLKDFCENWVMANYFERCIGHDDFLKLTATQLARILQREDLQVSREEIVLKGVFSWLRASKERAAFLGVLLQHVDLQSLSSTTLHHVLEFSASMGPSGHDVEREVSAVWRARRKRDGCKDGEDPNEFHFQPKRRCLKHWSPALGASTESYLQKLASAPRCLSMCCHEGTLYTMEGRSIKCRKLGEKVGRVVAGEGAMVNGVNDFGNICHVSVAPTGEIFVADMENNQLLTFQNGCGQVVLRDLDNLGSLHCSPTGAVYVLTDGGCKVSELVDTTLKPLISSETLPPDLQFQTDCLSAGKDNSIYFCDNSQNKRILRITPSEGVPVVIGQAPHKDSKLNDLHVAESGKVYITDSGLQTLWLFDPDDASWTRVLQCPQGTVPLELTSSGSSLFVNVVADSDSGPTDLELTGVYKVDFPAVLPLE